MTVIELGADAQIADYPRGEVGLDLTAEWVVQGLEAGTHHPSRGLQGGQGAHGSCKGVHVCAPAQ